MTRKDWIVGAALLGAVLVLGAANVAAPTLLGYPPGGPTALLPGRAPWLHPSGPGMLRPGRPPRGWPFPGPGRGQFPRPPGQRPARPPAAPGATPAAPAQPPATPGTG